MKKYLRQLNAQTGESAEFYLASDVEALREGLEQLAKELDPTCFYINDAYDEGLHDGREEAADRIQALLETIFGEVEK